MIEGKELEKWEKKWVSCVVYERKGEG